MDVDLVDMDEQEKENDLSLRNLLKKKIETDDQLVDGERMAVPDPGSKRPGGAPGSDHEEEEGAGAGAGGLEEISKKKREMQVSQPGNGQEKGRNECK